MDEARRKTDKILKGIEKAQGRIYATDPALIRIEKEYARYMKMVQKRTEGEYRAYINAKGKDIEEECKKAYMDAIRALTTESKEYRDLVRRIASVLAEVNQKALDSVNEAMPEIYAINYNQVAEECRRAGIEVYGNG